MPNTSPQKPRPSQARIAAVIAEVSSATGIAPELIRAKGLPGRTPFEITAARWAAWKRLIEDEGFGYSPTAKAWGCHHASIINAQRKGWRLG